MQTNPCLSQDNLLNIDINIHINRQKGRYDLEEESKEKDYDIGGLSK